MNKKLSERLYKNRAVRDAIRTLDPTGNTDRQHKEYVDKKLTLIGTVIAVGIVLTVILWIKDCSETKIADNKLYRNKYGSGSKQVDLVASNDDKEFQVSLEVREKQYSIDELNVLAEEFIPILEDSMLGINSSPDRVEYDLNFINSLDGYPFNVEWRTDSEHIGYDGELVQEEITSPVLVEITAVIRCGSFEVQHIMDCYVYPKAASTDEEEQLTDILKNTEADSRDKEFVILPQKLNNENINWSYKKRYMGLFALVMIPVTAMLIYYGKDRDLYKLLDERKEQLLLDYPEIVSRFALLVGAGMTVPNAWNKIVSDYKVKRSETGKTRYAYEEMLLAAYEMENGVMQTKAYERFGKRCRVPCYNKFATMLSQNIRKGTANLAVLLKEEAADAFEERKHTARKLGEKAGTKLLMPMMMLLGMIMVIIIIPAFKGYF